MKGNSVLPFDYEYMLCVNGVIVGYKNLQINVTEMYGDAVCIMKDGSQIIEENVHVLEAGDGICFAKPDGCELIVDNIRIEFSGYEYIDSYGSDLFSARKDDRLYIIDKNGTEAFRHNYDHLDLNGKRMLVRKNDEYGIVDLNRLVKRIQAGV